MSVRADSALDHFTPAQILDTLERQEQEREITLPIEDTYGSVFSNIVGAKGIAALPVVHASQMNLDGDGELYDFKVEPWRLGEEVAVRGLTGSDRPFVAMQVVVFNEETNSIVGLIVEVVSKKFALDGAGGKGRVCENDYKVAKVTTNREYAKFDSFLSRAPTMTEEQMKAVKLLLEGKTIESPVDKNLTLKLLPGKV